ncbi:MAG: hypothetical protein ACRDRX_16770 [Pseudonocardiaceae bacterium]
MRYDVIDKGDYAIVRPIPDDPVAALHSSHTDAGPTSELVRAAERTVDAAYEGTRTALLSLMPTR